MGLTVVVCTDGSDLALNASTVAVELLRPADAIVVATVVQGEDPSLAYDGTGHAGPTLTYEELEAKRRDLLGMGEEIVAEAVSELTSHGCAPSTLEGRVLEGKPGPMLCELAAEIGADVMIVGTRGRGGIKRAFLGSVSDHVVRHSPCPVIVTRRRDELD